MLQRIFFILTSACLVLSGCGHEKLMTSEGYETVEKGMKTRDLTKQFGSPYAIYSKGADVETYEYIERIMMGRQVVEQRRYYIVVSKGKVIAKYLKVSNPPPFDEIYSDSPYPEY